MGAKENEIRTVSIRQIEKNRDLALGAPEKDVTKYEKVIAAFGNVAPAIVTMNGGIYSLIDGQARVEAYARSGVSKIPVVIARTDGEFEEIKLSLLLSASREQGCPLSEGAMINRLIKEHGLTLRGLSSIIGRSKSWLSKRQSMARNLSAPLAGMILNGDICTRSAEEVAKLPCEVQAVFAANVVRDELCKDDIYALVKLYRSPDATREVRRAIIESPSDVLPSCRRGGKTRRRRPVMSEEGRLGGAARLAINVLDEIEKMIIACDSAAVGVVLSHLTLLRAKMQILTILITSRMNDEVSPGKREVIQNG